jgi:hypothetical protein
MGIFLDHYKSIIEDGEFRSILRIPADYLVPILLLCKMSPKELQNPQATSEYEQQIANQLTMGDIDDHKIVEDLVHYAGSGLYYLSIKYEKDEILILAHQGIRNRIHEVVPNKSDSYNAFFVSFCCYQTLLQKMINVAKQNGYCHEEVVEYNSLCASSVWDFMYGYTGEEGGEGDEDQLKTGLDIFVDSQTESEADFKQVFRHYDSNFGVLLIDESNFFSIPAILEHASRCGDEIFIEFVMMLEDILIKILTGNRICGENDRCRELCQNLGRLTKLELYKKSLRRATFKSVLHLSCVSLSELQDIHLDRKAPEFRQNLAEQVNHLKGLLEDLTQEKEL